MPLTVTSTEKTTAKIAIIGAGITGLTAGLILKEQGFDVTLFDKARSPGGRTANRRTKHNNEWVTHDLGAQYLRQEPIQANSILAKALHAGVIQKWQGQIGQLTADNTLAPSSTMIDRYVGTPSMSQFAKWLAAKQRIRLSTHIAQIAQQADQSWQLTDNNMIHYEGFTAIIVALPAPQTLHLLPDNCQQLKQTLQPVVMQPCWSCVYTFNQQLPLAYDGIFLNKPMLSWAARGNSKPDRGKTEAWVLHCTAQWSEQYSNAVPATVAEQALQEFTHILGLTNTAAISQSSHRWLYAKAANPLQQNYLAAAKQTLFIAGDWLAGDSINGAIVSGTATAQQILNQSAPNSVT